MKSKKYVSLVLGLSLMLTAFSGCSSGAAGTTGAQTGTATAAAKAEGTAAPGSAGSTDAASAGDIDKDQYLNVISVAEPSTLDASKGSDGYSNTVLNNVLEPLTRMEEDQDLNNKLAPAGAESWESNADGTVWTFKIRDNKWSDGAAVKAQDYEYGIKRSLDAKTASPYAFILTSIKNARKVNSGKASPDELGVKALDDRTLEITLEAPTPYFEQLTYQRVMMPQRKDIVEKYGDTYGSEPDKLVYNGPFTISEWVHNSKITLRKNPTYWDAKTVKLETINMSIVADENAIYNSLANGSADQIGVGKTEWLERFKKQDNLKYIQVVQPSDFFLFFNTKDSIFKNANVRKAFSMAVNREGISNVIFNGLNVPANGWVPPSMILGSEEFRSVVEEPVKKLVADNPDPKAVLSKGLTELGLDPDPAKLTIELSLGSTDQWFRTYGEYLQQMYKTALGVTMNIQQLEWPVFDSNVQKGKFQIGYMAWGADFNDPANMLSLFVSDSAAIATGWKNERFDELIDLGGKTLDQAKRREYYVEAEKILLYDEAVVAPVVYPQSNLFRYNYVYGMSVTPFGTSGWKYAYTKGRK